MATPTNTPPQLPVETWTAILADHGLTYFDLRRVARVSKTLRSITELLVRGTPPVQQLAPRSIVLVHPALVACDSLAGIEVSSFVIKAVGYQDDRKNPPREVQRRFDTSTIKVLKKITSGTIGKLSGYLFRSRNRAAKAVEWKICDLTAASEFATWPPLTTLIVSDIGFFGEAHTITDSFGVTVADVLNGLAEAWARRFSELEMWEIRMEMEDMGDGDSDDGPSNLPETLYGLWMDQVGVPWRMVEAVRVEVSGGLPVTVLQRRYYTSPELPVETWTAILTEHGLTYFDLKRVAQVSKTLKAITELTPGTKVAIHPVLLACEDFVRTDPSAFFVPVLDRNSRWWWSINDLPCAHDNATSPPLTELVIADIGEGLKWKSIRLSGPLRVLEILNCIAQAWTRPLTTQEIIGIRTAEAESRFDLYAEWDGPQEPYEIPPQLWMHWDNWDGSSWELDETAIAGEEGTVILRRG